MRFMHDEALVTLPRVLEALEIREAILVGHSDGGSIALIHAGGSDHATKTRVRGLILEAPHVFVEDHGLNSIRAIAEDYRRGDLKQRLERYHGKNVETAFRGWNDVWLDPDFQAWNIEDYVRQIRVPVLLIQGEDDMYGTLEQIKAIENGCQGPVRSVVFKKCGHSPHLDQPEQTLEAMTAFMQDVLT